MCNEISRKTDLTKIAAEFGLFDELPPFEWQDHQIPNDLEGKASVRIGDRSLIVRLQNEKLVGEMATWAWKSPSGKPVFNFVSEGRDFSKSDRVLVFADGFYEFTRPQAPKVKLKDKHLFTVAGEPWFWIAGIVKEGCFTLLTTAPGPDLLPYHDRQIVVLKPIEGRDWLALAQPPSRLLQPRPAGALRVQTLRRDGVTL